MAALGKEKWLITKIRIVFYSCFDLCFKLDLYTLCIKVIKFNSIFQGTLNRRRGNLDAEEKRLIDEVHNLRQKLVSNRRNYKRL